MKKLVSILGLILLLNSCDIVQPYIDQYFGKKSDKEEVLVDKAPPEGYDPIFIIGEKPYSSILSDPKVTISRVEKDDLGKIKVYFHLVDEDLMLNDALDKSIWCEIVDTLNGKPRTITDFKIKEITESEKPKLATAIVMDHSGSMGDARARVMQEAVQKLLRSKAPKDLVSLIRYDSQTKVITEAWESNFSLLDAHLINGLEGMGGGTQTSLAIDKAIDVLSEVDDSYTKNVVVFTDGLNSNKGNMDSIIDKAISQDVVINAVDYGYNITPEFLDVYASETGGIYHHIYLTNEFDYVFDDLNYRMNQFYVLEFDSKGIGSHGLYLKACVKNGEISTTSAFSTIPRPGQVVLLNVYFDTGKASLKKASFEEIEKIEAFLKAHPEYKVKITGHTDYTGDPAKNDKLSIERANSVKDELVKRGINQGKILASGNGARNPIADNETKSGRAKNRRVEFQVLK